MAVTIKDIADILNVSVTTVSRVINNKRKGVSEDTRERVLKLAEELDYHPNKIARGLVTKRTNTIGVVLPDITNPVFPDLVRGIEDACNDAGYDLIICNSDNYYKKERNYIKILKEKCVDGIIYTGTVSDEGKNISLLEAMDIPFVVVDRIYDDKSISKVCTNSEKGLYELTKYIIENGHKKIAYISGPKSTSIHRARFLGFKNALEENGLSVDENLVEVGEYKLDSGYHCMTKLLEKRGQFTAVVCENDLIAIGACEAMKDSNIKIPDEISITGYDDIYVSSLITPRLTTVHQNTYKMGEKSIEVLIDKIEGNNIELNEVIFDPQIIIRETVKNIT